MAYFARRILLMPAIHGATVLHNYRTSILLNCGAPVAILLNAPCSESNLFPSHTTLYNPYSVAMAGSLAATRRARSTTTLACFQVASSCLLPSIITAPLPSGMAARIFFANATSAGSGENTRLAISTWVGCNDHAPTQPIRNALRNCASQADWSEKSPNGP